jgi:hypothetical protein
MPNWRDMHELGEPILPEHALATISRDMMSQHDTILHLENNLLMERSTSYLVFVVNVTKGLGFIDSSPGNMLLVRFVDVFNMFHLK